MWLHRAAAITFELASDSRTKHDRTCQGDEAADRVYDRRTGEVVKPSSKARQEVAGGSHRGQEPVGSPCPMSDDRVDKSGNGQAIEQLAYEPGSSDHRAGCDRGTGVSKRELEEPDREECHAGTLVR